MRDLSKYFEELEASLKHPLVPDITSQIAGWSIPPISTNSIPSVYIDWGSAVTGAPAVTDAPNDLPRIAVCDGHRVVCPQTSARWDSPHVALGGVLIKPSEQCFISCTRSEKERIMQLAESKWDKCPFADGCQEFYGYDCRKCLEHRIKWELTD